MDKTSVKLLKTLKLDEEYFKVYRHLRRVLKENGFTQEEIESISEAPLEVWKTHGVLKELLEKIRDTHEKYGFTNRGLLDLDISNYLTDGMKLIDQEISLEGNKGYYNKLYEQSVINESYMDFSKMEQIIKDKINKDSFEKNYIEDNVIYWDGETDVNESVEAVWEVGGVEVIPSKSDDCDLEVHMVIRFNSDHSFVYYENVGEGANPYDEPRRVRINYPQDVSWVIDKLKSKVKSRMSTYFPFPKECVVLYFD